MNNYFHLLLLREKLFTNYVILFWKGGGGLRQVITGLWGGGGVKKSLKNDYVICEWSLSTTSSNPLLYVQYGVIEDV